MRKDDDDSDLGLSAMMARNVSSATTSRGRDSVKDKAGKRISRSRSRSSSVLRKGKKKDAAPDAPRRDKSRDGYTDDDNKSTASRKIRRTKSSAGTTDDDNKSTASRKIRRTRSSAGTTDDENKSVASRKSTRSKIARARKKSGQSLTKTTAKPASPEAPLKSGSSDEKKEKKKSKKIRRVKRTGADGSDDGEDEYTIASKQSTRSSKSSDSLRSKKSKAGQLRKNTKNKISKQYQETSSRVEAIREPILSNEGVILKDEMDNLFPLPMDQEANAGKAKRGSAGDNTNSESNGTKGRPKSILATSQKSLSGASTSGSTAGSFGIMTNKAAAEQAEAALSRVAAHQSMEIDVSGGERRERQNRRLSNGSTRSKEQYQRLHRDSGLTSMTSINDDERSFSSRRSQSNFTAMTALQKRMDEYKAETETLQKRLYEALAEVEQSNNNLRKEKERSEASAGVLSNANSELEKVREEKAFLIESIRDMEDHIVSKDERVEKLQEVVETQLDTVEFLEDKLNKTEDELILMEEEITELIDVVEEKNKTEQQISDAKSKGQGRVARMVSMREDLISRKSSIETQKEESRRVLSSGTGRPSSDRPRSSKMESVKESNEVVEKLQTELKTREAKLKADLDECNNREQRLDTWERELFELEDQLKKENEKVGAANKNAASSNSEDESLIDSLEKEKEDLRKTQMETQSKLRMLQFENDDLKAKLDRVSKMATENQKQIPVKSTELVDAQALVEKKEKTIKDLEEKIEKLYANGGTSQAEEDGKDLLIRELQNQLVNSKKEASALSSGNYVTRLKLEIKKLRTSVNDLKKRLKDAEGIMKSNLEKKDDAMRLLEKQMQKFKIELERRDKREKNFGAGQGISDSALRDHIEDLEDEISHWKSTNADLENELEALKSKADEQHDFYLSDDDIEDDCSIGSLASVNSKMSLGMSHEDNFFLSESMHSVGTLEEPATPSRAMRTVSNIFSRMRNGPEPPNPNQSFPYGPGSLND